MSLIHQESFLEKNRELAEVSLKFSSLPNDSNENQKDSSRVSPQAAEKHQEVPLRATAWLWQCPFGLNLQSAIGNLNAFRESCWQGQQYLCHTPVFSSGTDSIRKSQLLPIYFAGTPAFSDLLMSHRQGFHGNWAGFFPANLAGFLHYPDFLNIAQDWMGLRTTDTQFLHCSR